MPFNQGGMEGGMQGGMFGPPGGPQNLGGSVMSDLELQRLLGQMGSLPPMPQGGGSDVASLGGGTLPIYDMPAQLPQGTPSLGSGIDPSMMAGPPPAPPMDFGAQAITEGAGWGQQGLMNIGRQQAEEERLKRLLAMSGGGMGGGGNVPVRPATAGWLANPTSGHGMNAGWSPSTRRGFAP